MNQKPYLLVGVLLVLGLLLYLLPVLQGDLAAVVPLILLALLLWQQGQE